MGAAILTGGWARSPTAGGGRRKLGAAGKRRTDISEVVRQAAVVHDGKDDVDPRARLDFTAGDGEES